MSNRTKFIIYILVDPRTEQPRYLGKSCYGLGRPRRHAVLAQTEKTLKSRWIRKLLAAGLMYKIVVLERCGSHEELSDAEDRWLLAGVRMGWALTNTAPDDTGRRGKMSAETRAKISAAKKGKPRPDLVGKPRPDLAALNASRPKTKEERVKLAVAARNRPGFGAQMTKENRKKVSDMRKQEWSKKGWRSTGSPDGFHRTRT